jgi:hypothetical protein
VGRLAEAVAFLAGRDETGSGLEKLTIKKCKIAFFNFAFLILNFAFKKETPGDRRRAFLIGEELVPNCERASEKVCGEKPDTFSGPGGREPVSPGVQDGIEAGPDHHYAG